MLADAGVAGRPTTPRSGNGPASPRGLLRLGSHRASGDEPAGSPDALARPLHRTKHRSLRHQVPMLLSSEEACWRELLSPGARSTLSLQGFHLPRAQGVGKIVTGPRGPCAASYYGLGVLLHRCRPSVHASLRACNVGARLEGCLWPFPCAGQEPAAVADAARAAPGGAARPRQEAHPLAPRRAAGTAAARRLAGPLTWCSHLNGLRQLWPHPCCESASPGLLPRACSVCSCFGQAGKRMNKAAVLISPADQTSP